MEVKLHAYFSGLLRPANSHSLTVSVLKLEYLYSKTHNLASKLSCVLSQRQTKLLIKSLCKTAPKSLFLTHDCDGPVKKAIVDNFANQEGNSRRIFWCVGDSEQGSRWCFTEVTNLDQDLMVNQKSLRLPKISGIPQTHTHPSRWKGLYG